MKKWLLSVVGITSVVLIGIYLFIPHEIKISKIVFLKTNAAVANRFLMDGKNWPRWISPDSVYASKTSPGSLSFKLQNYNYTVEGAMMNTSQVSISDDEKSISSLMSIIPVTEDSVAVEWKADINAGISPVSRIKARRTAKEIENSMNDILSKLKIFLDKKENAYGFDIVQQQVTDTILISTKHISNSYPSTDEIYSMINNLRKYISNEGAKETNPPMLNIANEGGTYRTMVAIPVNKILPEKNDYAFKRMVPGKILVAEIKGGEYTARQALKQMDLYVSDHHLSSPAIPFESLITNRMQEPDTTKWITKIYYPIY